MCLDSSVAPSLGVELGDTDMATVKEFLVSTFGESAKDIADIDHPNLGGAQACNPRFMCSVGGQLQISCGGEVLIAFKSSPTIRGDIFLVRDDTAGIVWQRDCIGPRPHAVLRIVGSI